jgi:CheY-like chemotaxis protein
MKREHSVLIVEDNADDVIFIRRALDKSGIECPITVVGDGDSALEFLQARGRYADRAGEDLPTLVLLDLKLPRRSGLEVLESLRSDPRRDRMVVVVLTSSRESVDVERAYAAGANSYLVKPISPKAMTELVQRIGVYWLGSNEPSPSPRVSPP